MSNRYWWEHDCPVEGPQRYIGGMIPCESCGLEPDAMVDSQTGNVSVRASGAVTYWSVGVSTRTSVEAALNAIGEPNRMPLARDARSLTLEALRSIYQPSYLVRETSDGIAVVSEEITHGQPNAYREEFAVDDSGAFIRVHPKGMCGGGMTQPTAVGIANKIAELALEVTIPQMGHLLKSFALDHNAVTLRPTGGVYWLPASELPAWRGFRDALAAAKVDATVYVIGHRIDLESVQAVRDGLVQTVTSTVSELSNRIASGTLGKRALATAEAEASRQLSLVQQYETLLSTAVPELSKAVGELQVAASIAAIAQAAAPAKAKKKK